MSETKLSSSLTPLIQIPPALDDPRLVTLIERTWVKQPDQRPAFSEIIRHGFILAPTLTFITHQPLICPSIGNSILNCAVPLSKLIAF